ncbi:hypothetical protein [Bradyrhizobium jicamae]|uniref:hypothetical protein n=1 Tax=Bradyrhizobium jicamae TaxID=280332 RepID=UPI00070E80EA|nr:hypothetical protein [Bradyrhizobium jicamae]
MPSGNPTLFHANGTDITGCLDMRNLYRWNNQNLQARMDDGEGSARALNVNARTVCDDLRGLSHLQNLIAREAFSRDGIAARCEL